jgi:hypothetical protein
MSLNDIDMSNVEEPKDFGAVKPCQTRLRIAKVDWVDVPEKGYKGYYNLQTEFVDPASIEPYDASETPSAPFIKLYFHTPGALGMAKRALLALGLNWDEFVNSPDRDGYMQNLVGAEADAKITVQTKRKDTGEDIKPRNEARLLVPKTVS